LAQTNTFPSSGNVGIGTTSPAHTLDVVGSVNVSSGSAFLYNGASDVTALTSSYDYFTGGAGNLTMTGTYNTANGYHALQGNTSGTYNTADGTYALLANTTGSSNTGNGLESLYSNTSGSYNVANGHEALYSNTTGSYNIAMGAYAGRFTSNGSTANATPSKSIYIGYQAYPSASGDTNEIVIGNQAVGLGSNTTVLGNSSTVTTELFGNVGIGTADPAYPLAVQGTIEATAVIVQTGWSDYVFDKDYRLAPLTEVESYIKAEHHLPGVPSAKQVAKDGVSLGDMQSRLLAQIEQLTLRQIEQEKRLDEQEKAMRAQSDEIAALKREDALLRTGGVQAQP
jgi:hypothetical protein